MRGVNDLDQRKVIKAFLKSNKVDVVCLQETKIQETLVGMLCSLGAGRFSNWEALNSDEAMGGTVVSIDNRVLQWQDSEIGRFSISYRFRNK